MHGRVLAALAVTIVGSFAPVASAFGQPLPGEPTVIAKATITSPLGVQRDALSNRLVIASRDPVVSLVDPNTMGILSSAVTNVPGQYLIQFGPDNQRAYVMGEEPIISVIQVSDGALLSQIPLNGDDRNAAGSVIARADVPLLLVSYRRTSDQRLGAISLVSTETNFNRYTGIFPVETAGLALPKGRDVLLMATYGSKTLDFLDTFFQPVTQIEMEGTPDQVLVSPDGSRAYVTNPATGYIEIVDIDLRKIVSRIAIGPGMTGASISADGSRVATALPATGEFVVADTASAQVVARKKVAEKPTSTAFDVSGRYVFVADNTANAVLKVDTEFVRSSSPQRLMVAPTSTGVRVSWRPPSDPGTLPVTRYSVMSVPKGGKCVTTKFSCTLRGLKKGVSYTVRVNAESSGIAGSAITSKRFTAR